MAMHTLHFRKLTLCCALMFTAACGDDKNTDTDTDTTASTPATTTATDPTAGMTDPTADPTDGTADPTADPTATPTTSATDTTMDPTSDPTAGDGQFCQEQCVADADCTIMGADIGFTCKDGRCAGGCTDDAACVQQFSGWLVDCTEQAGCLNQVCIDIGGGVGKCATAPSMFVTCEQLSQDEVTFPPIEGGDDLIVCANTDYQCKQGQCQLACTSDAECTIPGLSKCDLDSGTCQCADDADCSANPDAPKCTEAGFCGCATDANCTANPNTPTCMANGFCGCATDDNCVASMTGDKCNNGACGCTDATACPAAGAFDGTTQVCESF